MNRSIDIDIQNVRKKIFIVKTHSEKHKKDHKTNIKMGKLVSRLRKLYKQAENPKQK